MFAFVPRRSVRIFTALCALSLAACGDDDEDPVHGDHNSETAGGAGAAGAKSGSSGAGGKAGAAGKAGSGGKAAAGAGGKASAGTGGGKAGAGGKAAAGAGGKAAAGAGGKAAGGARGAGGAGGAGGKGGTGGTGGTGGKAAAGAGAGGTNAGAGGTEAGSGGTSGVGGEGGSGPDETPDVATATLVGLALDGDAVVSGEDAGMNSENATATFTQTDTGVTLKVEVTGCDANAAYQIHIHSGTSCATVATQEGHWEIPRGEGIPNLECTADGTATLEYTRANNDPNGAWTVNGDENDVVGHVVVIHNPYEPTKRAACGKIE
jgi:hypothetical protein